MWKFCQCKIHFGHFLLTASLGASLFSATLFFLLSKGFKLGCKPARSNSWKGMISAFNAYATLGLMSDCRERSQCIIRETKLGWSVLRIFREMVNYPWRTNPRDNSATARFSSFLFSFLRDQTIFRLTW